MTEDMTDRIAVIVGGSPEVAEATARLLATRGAAGLMVCGRGAERGQALAAIISAAGCPTHFLPVDLARTQDCAAVITEAELVFGRIDVLIVGAGEGPNVPPGDTTPEKLDQLLASAVRAPFLLLQGAANLMKRTGVDGIMIATIGGAGPEARRTPATAACAGALAATAQGCAEALAADPIRVFGLDLYNDPTSGAVAPNDIARAIAELAAGSAPIASGSIIAIAEARMSGAITA
jgi:NAD(P)-dependent dehydrogenase (short-subunit alcohol dehydrogenase family)